MDNPFYDTMHFNLNDPEGERRLRECLDAPRVIAAVQEFDNWLRDQIKHHDQPLDAVRSKLYAVFERRAVTIWK